MDLLREEARLADEERRRQQEALLDCLAYLYGGIAGRRLGGPPCSWAETDPAQVQFMSRLLTRALGLPQRGEWAPAESRAQGDAHRPAARDDGPSDSVGTQHRDPATEERF